MMFSQPTILWGTLVVLGFWIGIMTVFVVGMIGHYNRLTKDISATGLKSILDAILQTQMGLKKQTDQLTVELDKNIRQGTTHIQRIGIVRFNPFADTGGTQSFTLALLDGTDNGIVVTSLYARTGNRWYVKEISNGQGKDISLSKEEMTAIKKAKHV